MYCAHVNTIEFHRTMDKVRGIKGEKYVAVDLEEIRESLLPYPDLLEKYNQCIQLFYNSDDQTKGREFIKESAKILPPGLGRFLLIPEQGKMEDALEVDAHTALMMTLRKNMLDVK